MLAGTYIDRTAGKVTLKQYATKTWLPAQVHIRPNTRMLYNSHLGTHVVPLLGGRQIGSLRRSDMKSFVAALTEKLAPATVHTVYSVLRAVMQGAVDDGLIPGNPCARVPLPKLDPRVFKPLTAAQVQALAENITPRYAVTVWLGAGAGLREGEALGLTKPRVAFLKKQLHVEEQDQNGELAPLKTKASRRTIPLDDVVVNALAAHMSAYALGPDEVLVTNRCRRMVKRSSFGHCWRQAVEAAGLPKGTRFHDLRHFYASTLIAAGLHPKVIQARLGHATMAETMDTYGHLFPDAED
jgi:integrase